MRRRDVLTLGLVALSAPAIISRRVRAQSRYPDRPIRLVIPFTTGGVNLETAGEFLKAGACAVAVGSELVDAKTIKEGRFDIIEDRARQYLAVIAKARAEIT